MIFILSSIWTSDNAAWIAAGISFFALIVSIISNRYSKKSYKLAKEIEEYNAPTISLYIIDKARLVGKIKFYSINLLISNLSRMTNSLNRVELEIFYSKDNEIYSIILEHNENSMDLLPKKFSCTKVPVNIEAGMSNKVSFYFRCDSKVFNCHKIIKYRFRVTDSYGKVYTEDFTLMNEVFIDDKDEKR